METSLAYEITKRFKASGFIEKEVLQKLWSNYGTIQRVELIDGPIPSAIVKHIQIPEKPTHPRGWSGKISHDRKLKSYRVENYWYKHYSSLFSDYCKMPSYYWSTKKGEELILVLEDLNVAGFSRTPKELNLLEVKSVLSWLAIFHTKNMGVKPEGLWDTGSYWHLSTRKEEWSSMPESALKNKASEISRILDTAKFQTIIHGDAKLANFCFQDKNADVAGLDFQYIGGGCGMKDVGYFLGSCLTDNQLFDHEKELLDHYFNALEAGLLNKSNLIDLKEMEQEWRRLYPFACADFHRFLEGWMPKHWKLNKYSYTKVEEVITSLK